MDDDVMNLMMFTLGAGGRDDYGKEVGERSVLLLDRTMARTRTSTSRLLQLPSEILADIVELLGNDKNALANFAQVNIECRQLARTAQFAEVAFDYSDCARSLVAQLNTELVDRKVDGDKEKKPNIGSCIRRVTFASSRHAVAMRHYDLYDNVFGSGSHKADEKEHRDHVKVLRDQAKPIYEDYRDNIITLLPTTMPNLDTIIWKERYSVGQNFFNFVVLSYAKHLKLYRVPLRLPITLRPKENRPWPQWPLKSLHLDVNPAWETDVGDDADGQSTTTLYNSNSNAEMFSDLVTALFKLCSSSLESLRLGYQDFMDRSGSIVSGASPDFPCLRSFHCGTKLASETFSAILNAPLRELQIGYFPRRGSFTLTPKYIPTLRTFSVFTIYGEEEAQSIAKFLLINNHIRKLNIGTTPDALLDDIIIPALATGKFPELTSLALTYEGPGTDDATRPHNGTISSQSLDAITTLSSLEQLCLTVGINFGYRTQWLIDHEELREHLNRLTNLRRLALCRDGYEVMFAGHHDSYYDMQFARDDVDLWERAELDRNIELFEAARIRDERRAEEAREEEREQRRQRGEQVADDSDAEGEEDAHGDEVEDAGGSENSHQSDEQSDGSASDTHADEEEADLSGVSEHDDTDDDRSSDSDQSDDWREPYFGLSRVERFELSHRNAMMNVVEEYAEDIPSLDWIYVGQLPFSIRHQGEDVEVTPLMGERDSCRTALDRMFGAESFNTDDE